MEENEVLNIVRGLFDKGIKKLFRLEFINSTQMIVECDTGDGIVKNQIIQLVRIDVAKENQEKGDK